jgi:hypothetical protein
MTRLWGNFGTSLPSAFVRLSMSWPIAPLGTRGGSAVRAGSVPTVRCDCPFRGAPVPYGTGMAFTAALASLLDKRAADTMMILLSGGHAKLMFHSKAPLFA